MQSKISPSTLVSDSKQVSRSFAWVAIGILIMISFLGPFLGLGSILNYLIPACSFAVATFLYFQYRLLYVEFVWWVWFLAALVRRLIDYNSGFTNPSPVLLAPYLATLPTLMTTFLILPKLHKKGGLPFIMAIFAIAYSFCVGIIQQPIRSVIISLLGWLMPIVFGCYLFTQWRDYPHYQKVFKRTFLWCVLLVGSYGIYQFIAPPGWDQFWLTKMIDELGIVSFGTPTNQGIRVWGTMNGPLIFAACMSAGLLLLLSQTKTLSNIATVLGFLAFLLSQIRTSWLGLFIGLIALITSLKESLQIRLIAIISILAVVIISLALTGPFSEVVVDRTSTLTNIQSDRSANVRLATYQDLFDANSNNFLGDGLNDGGGGDSGFLEILIKLGWISGFFYLSSIILIIAKPVGDMKSHRDIFPATANAISLVMFVQLPLGAIMLDLPGMILWGFLGMKLAALKYYSRDLKSFYSGIKFQSR